MKAYGNVNEWTGDGIRSYHRCYDTELFGSHLRGVYMSSVAEDGVDVAKIGVYLDSRGGTRTRVAARNVPLDDVSG